MADEIERLVDAMCKGYETVDKWVVRYDHLFDDYELLRHQYEENRNHKAYTESKLLSRCASLEESGNKLKLENAELKTEITGLNTEIRSLTIGLEQLQVEIYRYKKREDIRMGMQVFDGV